MVGLLSGGAFQGLLRWHHFSLCFAKCNRRLTNFQVGLLAFWAEIWYTVSIKRQKEVQNELIRKNHSAAQTERVVAGGAGRASERLAPVGFQMGKRGFT